MLVGDKEVICKWREGTIMPEIRLQPWQLFQAHPAFAGGPWVAGAMDLLPDSPSQGSGALQGS